MLGLVVNAVDPSQHRRYAPRRMRDRTYMVQA